MRQSSQSSIHLAALLAVVSVAALAGSPAAARVSEDATPGAPLFSLREASAPPELAITFEEAAVVAAELTPGGDAVFWSVAREPQGYFQRVVRRDGLVIVDALGEARFEPEGGAVPLKSVWAVVDVASGGFAVAAPPGFELDEVPFPGRAFEVGAPGVVNRLRHAGEALEVLVVRPGVGAWRLATWDASPRDRDRSDDDRVLLSLEDVIPLEASGPGAPERFAGDDVIVVLDPRTLRVYATRLLGPPQPDGGEVP